MRGQFFGIKAKAWTFATQIAALNIRGKRKERIIKHARAILLV